MLVRGHRAPIVGAVSMDMLTVDVTRIDGVSTGDEVVLLGSQGDASWQTIDAREMAAWIGTIPYEVLCRLGARVARRYELTMSPPVRYRFGTFVLSPRGRTLTRAGQPVPLIPKYFDVLQLLVERRADAVSKADIFAAVWSDVIVTDGALAQAVRTLRRALDDDSREPRYIRTVSRHGYQFVAAGVVEEPDAGGAAPVVTAPSGAIDTTADAIAAEVDRLIAAAAAGAGADARDAAGRLHADGTDAAVAALRARPGHARALAYLRDARWDDPTAGGVPAGQRSGAHPHRLRGRALAADRRGAARGVAQPRRGAGRRRGRRRGRGLRRCRAGIGPGIVGDRRRAAGAGGHWRRRRGRGRERGGGGRGGCRARRPVAAGRGGGGRGVGVVDARRPGRAPGGANAARGSLRHRVCDHPGSD